jgi:hypothetical protein
MAPGELRGAHASATPLRAYERVLFSLALDRRGGNQTRAARDLGVSYG